MKCDKCGYYNKTGRERCVKCGNPLDNSYNSAIRKYKDSATSSSADSGKFSGTEKFIIAIAIVAVLMLVLSAIIPPDLDVSGLLNQDNGPIQDTQPVPIEDSRDTRLNTTIRISSIGAKIGEKAYVNAYVYDENNNPVQSGTASGYVNDIKYSGQVNNGNVNIVFPEIAQDTQVNIMYEGNDEYCPSETTAYIEITKEESRIDAEVANNTLTATLKSFSGNVIKDASIKVITNNGQTQQQTDSNGQIKLDVSGMANQEVKLVYDGNDQYGPCEKTVKIEQEKTDTKMDTRVVDNTLTLTLKTATDDVIGDASIKVIVNNNETQQKTEGNGQLKLDVSGMGGKEVKFVYDGSDQYNPCEKSVNIEQKKTDTKIDTQYDEVNHVVTAKLTDSANKPIEQAEIKIDINHKEDSKYTKSDGTIEIELNEGSNDIELKYDGNDTLNPSKTSLNIIVSDEHNNSDETTNDTRDSDDKVNSTINTTEHNTTEHNATDDTGNVTQNETMKDTKFNTEFDRENSVVNIQLTTEDNKPIPNEYVLIKFANGTEKREKTSYNGTIKLNLTNESNVGKIEFVFSGNEEYSSSTDFFKYD